VLCHGRSKRQNLGVPEDEPTISAEEEPQRALSGLQRVAVGLFSGVLLLSVSARAFLGGADAPETTTGSGQPPPEALGLLVPGAQAPPAESAPPPEPGAFETLLPYFSEGSFFGLIGFAVGYASRKFVKLALILLAVFFVLLQILVYADIATIDWGRAIDTLNTLILNLEKNRSLSEILVNKVPTTGAFGGGLLLGFRKG